MVKRRVGLQIPVSMVGEDMLVNVAGVFTDSRG